MYFFVWFCDDFMNCFMNIQTIQKLASKAIWIFSEIEENRKVLFIVWQKNYAFKFMYGWHRFFDGNPVLLCRFAITLFKCVEKRINCGGKLFFHNYELKIRNGRLLWTCELPRSR